MAKNFLPGFDRIFHIYLMRGLKDILKKLNSYGGFLSYHLDKKANLAHRTVQWLGLSLDPHF